LQKEFSSFGLLQKNFAVLAEINKDSTLRDTTGADSLRLISYVPLWGPFLFGNEGKALLIRKMVLLDGTDVPLRELLQ
jgi:hypothetical protein